MTRFRTRSVRGAQRGALSARSCSESDPSQGSGCGRAATCPRLATGTDRRHRRNPTASLPAAAVAQNSGRNSAGRLPSLGERCPPPTRQATAIAVLCLGRLRPCALCRSCSFTGPHKRRNREDTHSWRHVGRRPRPSRLLRSCTGRDELALPRFRRSSRAASSPR